MRMLMRTRLLGIGVLAATSGLLATTAKAEGLEGKWKLVVLALGQDEFLIVDVKQSGDGKLEAKVLEAQEFLGKTEVQSAGVADGAISLELKTEASGAGGFTGKAGEGEKGPILGSFRFRDTQYPARLERTEDEKLAEMKPSALVSEFLPLRRVTDLKERYEKIGALIETNRENPAVGMLYPSLLEAAEGADASAEEVSSAVSKWAAMLEPYGTGLAADARLKALRALAGKKPYSGLALELAKSVDAGLGEDAPVKQRAEATGLLAKAAEAAGDDLLARSARERAEKLELELDEEYKKTVPPFEPEKYAGRKAEGQTSVVLMELFTGAQCPPCVAADVAFDALLETYEPKEFVGLQYHLHIPGPDPLTNPATVERAQYYEVRSTPTSLINGEAVGRGGGPMGFAEGKYDDYRKTIEEQLAGTAKAAIDLTVKRDGNKLAIMAKASAEGVGESARPVLRLALVEESVRYVGGNALRFHHHVVRDLPGGADGKALEDGKCTQEVVVDLGQVRETIENYLSDYAKNRSFPGVMPGTEMKELKVVAFVQDDSDKKVWHAVMAEVE